jgi:hypothetical protein
MSFASPLSLDLDRYPLYEQNTKSTQQTSQLPTIGMKQLFFFSFPVGFKFSF